MNRCTRNGIVPPACDQIIRTAGNRCEEPLKTYSAMARVVSVPYSIAAAGSHGWSVVAARRDGRMHEHDGPAALEFGEHRIEGGVAEIGLAVTREEPDPVDLQRVVRVRDLGQRRLDVRHRHAWRRCRTGPDARRAGRPCSR